MNSPLSYGEKQDWGNKAIPPILAKCLGVIVFLFSLVYLWKMYARNIAMIWQGCMAALAAALLIILVTHFAMKVASGKTFWALYTSIFLLVLVLGSLALS